MRLDTDAHRSLHASLNEAHLKLCSDIRKCFRPPHMQAADVLNRFSADRLGKRLALSCLCEIINHVQFPKDRKELHDRLIERAEDLILRILSINPSHEFHVDVVRIEQLLNQDKSIEEIAALCGKHN